MIPNMPGTKSSPIKDSAMKENGEIHMALHYSRCRLARDKRVEIGLTYIYGIGRASATRILTEMGID